MTIDATTVRRAILHDREQRRARPAERAQARPTTEGTEFDPFKVTRWRVIAGGDRGYVPRTRMRMGPLGWFIECQCCAREFESKGSAYCPTCMESPAQERRANGKPVQRSVPANPTRHRTADLKSPAGSLLESATEIIEEFPPVFGSADFPSILVGSGRRGRMLDPELVATILQREVAA
jgi:hypothetical protein